MPTTAAGQAKSLHDEGAQRLEEARRDFLAATGRVREADSKLKGELTEAERKTWREKFTTAFAEAKDLKERAAALAEVHTGEQEMEQLATEPHYTHPMGGEIDDAPAADDTAARLSGTRRVGQRDGEETLNAGDWGPSDPKQRIVLRGRARTLLNQLLRGPRFAGGAELHRLKKEDRDFLTRPRPETLMSPYVDRDGGMITAEEVRNEVIGLIRDMTFIRGRARVIATTASSVAFPTAKIRLRLAKTRAGRGTGETPTTLRDVFGKTRFVPDGHGKIVKVPEELLEDATFDVIGFLSQEIANEDLEAEEEAFISGTGNGEPLGILTALARLDAAGYTGLSFAHTGSANADLTPEDIKTFPYKLRKVFRAGGPNGAAWTTGRALLEKVTVMRDDSGGAGTGQFLFRSGIEPGDPDTLAGYPIIESEFFPDNVTSGSAGDPILLFGNWRYYWIVDRKSLELKVLQELYSETDEVGYKYSKRYDGAPVRAEAFVMMERK